MPKSTSLFICSKCDAQFPKWSGRCPDCGAWGSLNQAGVEQIKNGTPATVVNLRQTVGGEEKRLLIGNPEIDRVLGGGLVTGSLILLGGEPGIGKSTLVLQLALAVGARQTVLYASGEESAAQVKLRLQRLDTTADCAFAAETNLEKILSAAATMAAKLLIIDSIQTIYSEKIPQEAGSLNQIRACALDCLTAAKQNGLTIILIGHITKDGSLAGPKTLEHLVDTVLYLEESASDQYRLLRAAKNRFGSTNELGILEMTGQGLVAAMDPSTIFLAGGRQNNPGSAIGCVLEGSRPFLLEVQALTGKTVFGYPQRKSAGFDLNRLQILAAVLTKRGRLNLSAQDIILNVAGGMKTNDPALDLTVCLAIAASLYNQTLPEQCLILGEIGLSGEIRPVSRLAERLKEAAKLNFTDAWLPPASAKQNTSGLRLRPLASLAEALEYFQKNQNP